MSAVFISNLRQNVMRGMMYNAENALYNGRPILGFKGRPEHRYEIDEETAPIVRRVFREYVEGVPMKKICDGLNEDGFRTIRRNEFVANSMRAILTNRAYISEYKFGDIVIPDGIPRLIDDDMFQAAQERLKANKRGGKGAVKRLHPESAIQDYWLTGKLHCGLCGGAMQGISGTNKKGRLYYYYSCQNHRKHFCKMKNQRKELLEAIVLHLLGDLLRAPALRILIAEACYAYHMSKNEGSEAYEASIEAELKDVGKKLANIMKAVEAGIFNDTTAERITSWKAGRTCWRTRSSRSGTGRSSA